MVCQQTNRTPSTVELADIFRLHGEDYCRSHGVSFEQQKVINAIKHCRTARLGGHVKQCDNCGAVHNAYNSCRNRHCPKCQALRTRKWLDSRQRELLPVPYFHVVFTMPHELNNLTLYNKRLLYKLLMSAAWETIQRLGKDPKRLNGLMGMIAILHTWSQNLSSHNHLHCIVPGIAITADGKYQLSRSNYLFPVKVMSKIFRKCFVTHLKAVYSNLAFPTDGSNLACPKKFDSCVNNLMKKEWVVYAKKPFAGPEKLLDYLGRYTHKIAISNNRILSCDQNSVVFKWRDYADKNQVKNMRLQPAEFIHRFLSHVVPKGFMRIRFFGFLANACKTKRVAMIRNLLSYHPPTPIDQDTNTLMKTLTGIDISLCPTCQKGQLHIIDAIPAKFSHTLFDTS